MDQTDYPIIAISVRSGRIFNLFASHDAPLIKADGGIPPGARWITVHPNGNGEKGVPVLIQETSPGSGVHRVVGGAGGKLNYLRLKGVKSEAQYRQEHANTRKAKTAEKAAQRKRDKELGLTDNKRLAKQALKSERVNQEQEYIKTVADALGWTDHEFDPEPYKDLSVRAQSAAFQKHHRETLKRANEAVKLHEQQLMADGEARAKALGEVPLESDDTETIALADLDPEPSGSGLGYAPAWKQQAEEKAGGSDVIKAEKEALEAAEPEEKREAKAKRKATAETLKAELETVRDPTPKDQEKVLVDVEKTVAMLKAKKQLALAKKKLADASRKVDEAKTDPHAYVIEVEGPDEKALIEAVKADIESDLRTLKTRAFLSEVEKSGGEVAKDFGVGAYNSLNSIALTATGASLLDRQVVDALGVAGASQVLAKRLRDSLTPKELEDLKDGLQSFHMEHYMEASDKAMGEAIRLQAAAEALELDAAKNGHDLARLQEINAERRDSVAHARRILSTTLGEMEANAAMLVALKQGDKDSIEVPLGKMGLEDAIIRARAIGLDRGDYTINSVGSERFLTIAAMDKLTASVDKEDLAITHRAMRIMDGYEDEEGWLPQGIANRPDLAAKPTPGVAPRMAEPLAFTGTAEDAVRDYIGGRAADGDHPRDIVADLLSQDFKTKADQAGQGAVYQAAIDKLAPLKDANGNLLQPEEHAEAFEALAQAFAEKRYGGKLAPLHRQTIAVDQVSVDALHRALAAEPAGVLAFKDLGELTRKDQKALRDWWWQAVGKKDEAAAGLRADLDAHAQQEPEKEIEDMFGDRVTVPEWTEWKAKRDDLAEQLGASGLDWNKYASVMGGHGKAYEAVQDLIRSKVAKGFHEAHNTLRPGEPVKLGRSSIRNNLAHLDAVDPEVRERRIAEHRDLIDGLRERGAGGQYASGSVMDKLDEAREQRAAFEQSQMGLFGSDDMFGGQGDMFGGGEAAPTPEKPLEADQRYTLGHAAERTLAGMVQTVGQNFRPGKPTQLWSASMSGKYVPQQRAIKMLESSKKMAMAAGVGSGKTVVALGGFTHLHAQGKVKRGLFVVPSPVQGQFQGEALRYLEPNTYKWHAEPGASREERMAAYRDPETHFSVVTHQAFRDDMIHLAADKDGISKDEAATKIRAMAPAERKAYMREVMDHGGIDHDYIAFDESHDALNRAGKKDSLLAGVFDGVAHNMAYQMRSSADPVKNDSTELFSLLHSLDPDRFSDSKAFMRKYGVDTPASKAALKREMARYLFPASIDSGVKAEERIEHVKLTDAQHTAIAAIDKAAARVRLARMRGTVDVESAKTLSPNSFEGVDPGQHEAVAKKLASAIGPIKNAAVLRAINANDGGAKIEAVSKLAADRKGKPGVVFAHSLDAVARIADRLKAEGHRVVVISGNSSTKEKDKARLAFNPETGEPEADILVASDAAATGLNLQRGQWLAQVDISDTAKTHRQRQGRINRLGQKNNVELIDLVADHPAERRARERLRKKDDLRGILTSPMSGLDDTGLAAHLNQARVKRQQGDLF